MLNNAYWIYESVLDKDFCNYVVNSLKWEDANIALTTTSDAPKPSERITNVIWQPNNTPIGCVLQFYVSHANYSAGWNFDVQSFEQIQMSEYKDNGHYDWHMDSGTPVNGIQRKLSCSILLNDPSEFEGGELELKNSGPAGLKQGSIIVFPSFLEHRVTAVTSGTRYSAVSWAKGPAFR
jgi:PKHD-type hydroxylase